ncbi:MAG: hypothetical protein OXI23_21620 [Gemmatimonadota bacterium]|nr:hypothetical protein [Gemmatimonadota bacterium]
MRSSCAAGISAFFSDFLACCAGFLAFFAGFLAFCTGFLADCFFAVFLDGCFFAGFLGDRFFDTRGVEDLVFVFFAGFLAVFFVACFFDGRFAFFAVDVAPCVSRGSSACVFAFAIISFRK